MRQREGLCVIKVLNVISDTNIGGAGKCVLTFLKYYSKDEFDLAVVIPKNSLLKPEIEKLGARCIEVDALADKSLDFKAVSRLLKIFKAEKPDVIHCHAAMSARIAGRLYKRAKIVYTRHSVFEPSPAISRGIGKRINGFVNNATADRIIAVADAAKDNLTKTGVSDKKITVIQNGVEPLKPLPESEKQKIRSEYGVGENDFILGIAARLNEVKGHIYILEALKMLIDDGITNAKLIIAGTGDYEDTIRRKIAELNLGENVVMAGFVKDVSGFMNILSVSVNASFGTEATSLALLEGMSLGVPAVVSDFGGNPGVIEEGVNGYLFESKNSRQMYEKLKLALQNGIALKDMCKKVFEERFRAEIMTEKIQQVYRNLAKEIRK